MLKEIDKYQSCILTYVNHTVCANDNISDLQKLADGLILSELLEQVQDLQFCPNQLNTNISSWSERLQNLRVLRAKVVYYFQHKIGKTIKIDDLNLVKIAYKKDIQQIKKLFEIILATVIESLNKEDFISQIMNLDEGTQKILAKTIQQLLQNRVIEKHKGKQHQNQYCLKQFKNENSLLRQQNLSFSEQRLKDQSTIKQLQFQIRKHEQDFQSLIKSIQTDSNEWSLNVIVENELLKNQIEKLKKQISTIKNQHKAETFKLRDQNLEKQLKIIKLAQVDNMLELYKEKYKETLVLAKEGENWQNQKKKLLKNLQEKDTIIKKLQDKVQNTLEENYALQEREVYFQMEIQKRQVRFQQLEKQVKNRIKPYEPVIMMQKIHKNIGFVEPDQQIQELEKEVNKLKIKEKQIYWNRTQLRRKTQQEKNLNSEKKKLQRIILDLSKANRDEIDMLLSVIYELYSQNSKLIHNNIGSE